MLFLGLCRVLIIMFISLCGLKGIIIFIFVFSVLLWVYVKSWCSGIGMVIWIKVIVKVLFYLMIVIVCNVFIKFFMLKLIILRFFVDLYVIVS